jgi:hypothetical protein
MAIVVLLACVGSGIFAYRLLSDAPKNPSEAVSKYFSSIKSGNSQELSEILCSASQDDARRRISAFRGEFENDGVTLTDIRWTNDGVTKEDGKTRLNARVSYEVEKNGETFVRNAVVEFEIQDNRVCTAEERK